MFYKGSMINSIIDLDVKDQWKNISAYLHGKRWLNELYNFSYEIEPVNISPHGYEEVLYILIYLGKDYRSVMTADWGRAEVYYHNLTVHRVFKISCDKNGGDRVNTNITHTIFVSPNSEDSAYIIHNNKNMIIMI